MKLASWSWLAAVALLAVRHAGAIVAGTFAVDASSGDAPCRCGRVRVLLQQNRALRRPRDCTCITGIKSYATTPREKLDAMGKVALHHHLAKCQREHEELVHREEYETADHEAQKADAEEAMEKKRAILNLTWGHAAERQQKAKAEEMELLASVARLKTQIATLKGNYTKIMARWLKVSSEAAVEGEAAGECGDRCPGASASTVLVLLDSRGEEQRSSPELVREVEECEQGVADIADRIKAAQLAAQSATFDALEGMDGLDRTEAERQRMAKLLSNAPRLEALKKVQSASEASRRAEQQKVDSLTTVTSKLEASMSHLRDELKKCGCKTGARK